MPFGDGCVVYLGFALHARRMAQRHTGPGARPVLREVEGVGPSSG